MMFGALLGQNGFTLPGIETTFAMSLIMMGLLITFAIRLSVLPCMLMTGLFAVLHGNVLGAEIPQTLNVFNYSIGFILAACVLYGAGIALAQLARNLQNVGLFRMSGIAISLMGAWLWT
jgi:urease accessory protein